MNRWQVGQYVPQIPLRTAKYSSIIRCQEFSRPGRRRRIRFLLPPLGAENHGENSEKDVLGKSSGEIAVRSTRHPSRLSQALRTRAPVPTRPIARYHSHRNEHLTVTDNPATSSSPSTTLCSSETLNIESQKLRMVAYVKEKQVDGKFPKNIKLHHKHDVLDHKTNIQTVGGRSVPVTGHGTFKPHVEMFAGTSLSEDNHRHRLLPHDGLRSSSIANMTSLVTAQGMWDFDILDPSTFIYSQERIPKAFRLTPTEPNKTTIPFARARTLLRLLLD